MGSVHSYNAGYHRGLNTEFHDRAITDLFKEWVESTAPYNVPIAFDPVTFEAGYKDGLLDYLNSNEMIRT